MDILQQSVYKTRYARFLPSEHRREHWPETVARYMHYMHDHCKNKLGYTLTADEYMLLDKAILNLDVMPSMRALMTAGPALDVDNVAGYNCAYMEVSAPECFSEALYILMNGTGIGFSCERNYITKLPDVPKNFYDTDRVIVVQDSKIGWANAYKDLIDSLYSGVVPKVDYSLLRAAGERLKTFGGRASGPDPLKRLFEFTVESFKGAAGKKLTSIEVHDIMCVIGEVVVVGGVRRSALISLSNLSDLRMREAKVGAWWEHNKHRALANNSVAYTEKPDVETYFEEFSSLVRSKSGERGIFNRVAARRKASREGRRSGEIDYGCNPCSEIILRDKQFC